MTTVERDGGLSVQDIRDKLVCFSSDGALVLQGKHSGIVVQMQGHHALHY